MSERERPPGRSLRRIALAACSSLPLVAGCYQRSQYLVDERLVAQARQLDEVARPHAVLPALRVEKRRPVKVRASTLLLGDAQPESPGILRVPSRAYSPMITAGSLITWIGSGISIVASAIFFVYKRADLHDPLGQDSAAVALSAEPIMLVGTMLWTFSDRHRPEESIPEAPALLHF